MVHTGPRTMTTASPPWSDLDIRELRRAFRDGMVASDVAAWLLRSEDDVRRTAQALGIAVPPDVPDARKEMQ
jgi:hypothetical protein